MGSPVVSQPCVRCGRETGPVDRTGVDRIAIENLFGPDFFLCEGCDALLRSAEANRTLSEEEVRSFVDGGSLSASAQSKEK
jgi:hypothetical protein